MCDRHLTYTRNVIEKKLKVTVKKISRWQVQILMRFSDLKFSNGFYIKKYQERINKDTPWKAMNMIFILYKTVQTSIIYETVRLFVCYTNISHVHPGYTYVSFADLWKTFSSYQLQKKSPNIVRWWLFCVVHGLFASCS